MHHHYFHYDAIQYPALYSHLEVLLSPRISVSTKIDVKNDNQRSIRSSSWQNSTKIMWQRNSFHQYGTYACNLNRIESSISHEDTDCANIENTNEDSTNLINSNEAKEATRKIVNIFGNQFTERQLIRLTRKVLPENITNIPDFARRCIENVICRICGNTSKEQPKSISHECLFTSYSESSFVVSPWVSSSGITNNSMLSHFISSVLAILAERPMSTIKDMKSRLSMLSERQMSELLNFMKIKGMINSLIIQDNIHCSCPFEGRKNPQTHIIGIECFTIA